MTDVRVYPNPDNLAQAAAEQFVDQVATAIAAREWFIVALAGGSTPRPMYERLAAEPLASRVDWTHVQVFWSDERCVPADHPDSNYRMARQALLDHVPIPEANVHRIRGEMVPDWAASSYESELEGVLGLNGRFDLILLGMGADGHTASLFPGTRVLEEQEYAVDAVHLGGGRGWRVTLTLPVINAARCVMFLVAGAEKAEALARIRAGEMLPAARIQPHAGELIWLVDRDALPEA
ncbi:MAG: 6-phosphogluconolactonase [Anaerolineae bacterium]|jgi:6-phosphogluconolactonase